jgi:hypothetical protein
LHKRGGIFLVDAFHGNAQLADSVNHLLVVGFYLINIGFVSLALKTPAVINNSRSAIELLSDKMGMVLLILGGMHFFNLYVFSRIRQGSPASPPPHGASAAGDAQRSPQRGGASLNLPRCGGFRDRNVPQATGRGELWKNCMCSTIRDANCAAA